MTAWHAVFDLGQKADDVAFLSALIAHLKETLAVDPKRVYMAGHSSGAMMTYRYAAERGGDLAAIGAVAGSVGSDYGTDGTHSIRIPAPVAPVSVIAFHGKADPTVPYDWRAKGGEAPAFHFVPAPEPKRTETFAGNIVRETWTGGKQGTEVVFYTIVNGNHKYPGGVYSAADVASAYGPPNRQIFATPLIGEFFRLHRR